MTTVVDVLHERRQTGSLPGKRNDAFKVAVVIEGGGNRAAFSAGMTMGLDALGLTAAVDAVYGTSGGALNGAWLLTGQAQERLPTWASADVAAAKVTDPRRLLRGGTVVDTRVLVEHVYEQVTPMDFEAILANPITFHPIATDARTGRAHDLAEFITDRATLQSALRASICLPLLAGRPVALGGHRWLDGGLAESVPFRTATTDGATHLVVLRTRRAGQQAEAPAVLERAVLAPYFAAFAPGVRGQHATRHLTYADDEAYLLDPGPTGPDVLQLRPPADAHDVSRLSKDLGSIAEAIQIGYETATAALR